MIWKYFLHFVGFFPTFLIMSFDAQKSTSYEVKFVCFPLIVCGFGVIAKKPLLIQVTQNFPYVFF